MENISYVITILSLIVAFLAWFVKLRWSKEYSQAKDATINAKESQIKLLESRIEELEHFNPIRIKEYNEVIRVELQRIIDDLKDRMDARENEFSDHQRKFYKGLALLSFELLTPLNCALGMTELLKDSLGPDSQEHKYCTTLEQSLSQLKLFQDPLLDFELLPKLAEDHPKGENFLNTLIQYKKSYQNKA